MQKIVGIIIWTLIFVALGFFLASLQLEENQQQNAFIAFGICAVAWLINRFFGKPKDS